MARPIKNPLVIFLSLLAAISLLANFTLLQKINSGSLVAEVVDGDTFQLKSGQRVRLMGVDAPEYDRCAGPEAKDRLKELILGKQVRLAESAPEEFGRDLALVYVGDILVNKVMLEEGWGRPDYRKNSQREILTAAYHQAQGNKIGFFSLCLSSTPPKPACNIKGNIDQATYAKFYHLPGCRHYQEVVLNLAFGEQWFCSEKEALAAGFKKAAGCP